MKNIAVIGAGIAGSQVAKLLSERGFAVEVFEKARGAGGRCSSRRVGNLKVDHGAQVILAKSELFKNYLKEQIIEGNLAKWHDDYCIAIPAMNQLCKHNLKDVKARYATEIKEVKKEGKKLNLLNCQNKIVGTYDLVISTAPPLQSAALLKDFTKIYSQIKDIKMKAQFALIIVTEKDPGFDFNIANYEDSSILQITVNSNKPQRDNSKHSFVVHSEYEWSAQNAELDFETIKEKLLKELEKLTGFKDEDPIYCAVHRWLYSRTEEPLGKDYIYDKDNQIAICADWCLGNDIESAYLSAYRLAEAINSL